MNNMIEQLARDIIKSKDRHKIKAEIEWYLEGHYTKCRFIAILISCNLYKEEYYELLEKLTDRNLLLKLYKLIKNEN